MEYTILYSYWEHFHKQKKSIKEIWKSIDKWELLFMVNILFSAVCAVIVNIKAILEQNKSMIVGVILPIVFVAWELLSVVILYIYIDKKDIKMTKETIKNIKIRYTQKHLWFKEMGYTQKAEIEQFGYRCEKKLEEIQNDRREFYNHIDKMITIFYVPAMLAIISWILSSNQTLHDINEYILLVVFIVTVCAAVYFLILSIYKSIEKSFYSDVKKMKCMLRDIQGILDYCYDCKDDEIEFIHYKDEE